MPLTNPLGNNVLVEVIREDDLVSRSGENESMKYGKLIKYNVEKYHLTASAAIELGQGYMESLGERLEAMLGSVVRWEEFAEGGQTFEEDNKTYALIPWWRLIGHKEAE